MIHLLGWWEPHLCLKPSFSMAQDGTHPPYQAEILHGVTKSVPAGRPATEEAQDDGPHPPPT
ncbi:hypothetical protein PAHAL_5G379700 [Panicum hallii]|uniref:Uncharacterized protein n=1 Tax=Panicum hallii TaxID=206008 RepID=A0A2S3HVS6_9POAL|nr:hypothetical protein PAHAL_5G379700 [Panicum hallii]